MNVMAMRLNLLLLICAGAVNTPLAFAEDDCATASKWKSYDDSEGRVHVQIDIQNNSDQLITANFYKTGTGGNSDEKQAKAMLPGEKSTNTIRVSHSDGTSQFDIDFGSLAKASFQIQTRDAQQSKFLPGEFSKNLVCDVKWNNGKAKWVLVYTLTNP